MPTPSTVRITFGTPIHAASGEDSRRLAARIEQAVAELADEATTDWWQARRRAHAGATPALTGPGRARVAPRLGARRPQPQAPPRPAHLAPSLTVRASCCLSCNSDLSSAETPGWPGSPLSGRPDGQSTNRKPVGAIDEVAAGRSTTNSVRCAGKTCTETSTGFSSTVHGHALAHEHRRADGHVEQRRVVGLGCCGTDRLRRAAELDVEQLVERLALDLIAREPARRAPRGTTRSRARTARRRRGSRGAPRAPSAAPSAWRTRGGATTKPKSSTRRSDATPCAASCCSIVPSRPSSWRDRVDRDEPPEALPRRDQPLVAQQLERLAHGDPAHAVGC